MEENDRIQKQQLQEIKTEVQYLRTSGKGTMFVFQGAYVFTEHNLLDFGLYHTIMDFSLSEYGVLF